MLQKFAPDRTVLLQMAVVAQPCTDSTITHLPVYVQVPNLPASLLPVLQALWGANVLADSVQVTHLSGAMTNHVYRCDLLAEGSAAGSSRLPVIARVAGQDGNPNSAFELACCVAAANTGIGAQLLMTFSNGRIEHCLVEYRTLTSSDLHNPQISGGIAQAMARFHKCMGPELCTRQDLTSCNLWGRMVEWAEQAEQLCQDASQGDATGPQHSASTSLASDTASRFLKQLQSSLSEVEWLRDKSGLTQDLASWAVLGHNDAQYGNIMLQQQAQPCATPGHPTDNPVQQSCTHLGPPAVATEQPAYMMDIKLIDYDYTCWSEASFDIANHWCELAANYHTEQPHLLDYQRFPNVMQQRSFIQTYLQQMLAGAHACQLHAVNSQEDLVLAGSTGGGAQVAAGRDAWEATGIDCTAQPASSDLQPPYVQQLQSVLQATLPASSDALAHSVQRQGTHACCLQSARLADAGARFNCIHDWVAHYCPEQVLQAQEHQAIGTGGCGDSDALQLLEHQLHISSLAWTAVSHLHWALWGIIQHHVSTIDFDFLSYGHQRWEQYCLVRDVLQHWLSHATTA